MLNYAPLSSVWATTGLPADVTGTPLAAGMTAAEKLAAIGTWMVAGPMQDVSVSSVSAYLAVQGKLPRLEAYAAAAPATAATLAEAAAKSYFDLLPNGVRTIEMSNATVYAAVQGWLNAWTGDTNTGVTSTDVTNILALAATQIPWWEANGYPGPININDLAAAGLS
jgi:hypothetical protein